MPCWYLSNSRTDCRRRESDAAFPSHAHWPRPLLNDEADREQRLLRSTIRYFPQADALLINRQGAPVPQTRDLDEDTVLGVENRRHLCAVTVEHASEHAGVPQFCHEPVTV